MRKYVVAFNNKRDSYQVPIALYEAGLLERFFTDTYCSNYVYSFISRFSFLKSMTLFDKLSQRYDARLSSDLVESVGTFREFFYKFKGFLGVRLDHPTRNIHTNRRAFIYASRNMFSLFIYSYGWEGVKDAISRGYRLSEEEQLVVFQVHPLASQVKKDLRDRPDYERPEYEELQADALEKDYIEFLIQNVARIVCASEYVKSGLKAAGIPEHIISVVGYGFALERGNCLGVISDPNVAGKDRIRSKDKVLTLVYCGSLIYRKGITFLLDALEVVNQNSVVCELNLVTRSPTAHPRFQKEYIHKFNNLGDAEMRNVVSSSDLFVMPSLCEGFGLVYAEALSLGVPIVCTRNTGIVDFIQDGREGFIVNPGSVEDLVELLSSLSLAPARLDLMRNQIGMLELSRSWKDFRTEVVAVVSGSPS